MKKSPILYPVIDTIYQMNINMINTHFREFQFYTGVSGKALSPFWFSFPHPRPFTTFPLRGHKGASQPFTNEAHNRVFQGAGDFNIVRIHIQSPLTD